MSPLQTNALCHYQMKVYIALVSRTAGAQFMEANYLVALLG
jgi:hypothetical protein